MMFNRNGLVRARLQAAADAAGELAAAVYAIPAWADDVVEAVIRDGLAAGMRPVPLASAVKEAARGIHVYDGILHLYDRQLFGLRWHCRVRGMFRV